MSGKPTFSTPETDPELAALHEAAAAPRPPRRFTVMIPILRPPHMLVHSVASVLRQTERDLELTIICDGAPRSTVEAARRMAELDDRVHVFAFPKGERFGELHRAAVLRGSNAQFVAQLGDDDLWQSNHLETLGRGLRSFDFVTVPQYLIRMSGAYHAARYYDLANPATQQRMLTQRWNFFGPSEAGYRLEAYRSLPVGWAPGSDAIWSDLNMWRKFVAHPGLRFRSLMCSTVVKFANWDWNTLSMEARAEIVGSWSAILETPGGGEVIRRAFLRRFARQLSTRRLRRRLISRPLEMAPLLPLRYQREEAPRGDGPAVRALRDAAHPEHAAARAGAVATTKAPAAADARESGDRFAAQGDVWHSGVEHVRRPAPEEGEGSSGARE